MAPPSPIHLEDPFYTTANRSCSLGILDISSSGKARSAEDPDGNTRHVAGLGLFGYARPYQRRSSAVRMPSSPSSRNPNQTTIMQGSPCPQRASSSFLNASAAPWHPTNGPAPSTCPTYKVATPPLQTDPRMQMTPYRSPQRHPWHNKRRAALSDQSFFGQRHKFPALVAAASPAHAGWTPRHIPSYGHYFGSLYERNHNQSQLHSNAQTYISIPRPAVPHVGTHGTMQLTPDHMLKRSDQVPYHGEQNGDTSQVTGFDSYTPTPPIRSQTHAAPPAQINPYSQDGNAMGSGAYFPASTNYPQQVISLSGTAALYTR